jgi:hypothetical protein
VRWISRLAGIAALSVAPTAAGVERENQLGVDAGGAVLVVAAKSKSDVGAGVGAHWSYGLSDAFNLIVDGDWSLVALGETIHNGTTPRTLPTNVTNVGAGISYVFDVLRWVPWAGILVGGYALAGGTISGTKILAGAALALGLDYRCSRTLAIGVSMRQHVLSDMAAYPSFTQAFARIEYTWGW